MTLVEDEFKKWLSGLDGRIHHVGEFYSMLERKPFLKRNGYATIAFQRWYNDNYKAFRELTKGIHDAGFLIYRDRTAGEGFLLQRRGSLE